MNIDPKLAATFMIVAAGISLMYAVQLPIRIAGAMLASGTILFTYGWPGFWNFWFLLGVFMFFSTAQWRPLIRPARHAA